MPARGLVTDFSTDLGYTFNANMRKAGVDKSVIMKITGHKTMSIFERYNTVDRENARLAMERFDVYTNHQITLIITSARFNQQKKDNPQPS